MKHFVLMVASFFLAGSGVGQTLAPSEQFRLAIDLARFRGADDSTGLVEVYYSLPQRSLTYQTDSSGLSGAIDITATVLQGDSAIFRDRWLVPSVAKDSTMLSPRNESRERLPDSPSCRCVSVESCRPRQKQPGKA